MTLKAEAPVEAFLLAQAARLRAYARVLTGGEHDAEDVVQAAFVNYLRDGPRARDGWAEAWLFRVVRNEAMDLLRATRRRQRRHEHLGEAPPREDDPAEAAENAEARQRIEGCMRQLDPDIRDLVYLKFVEGLSLSDVAEQTHMPRSTVALRVRQGLVQLNRLFHTNEP